MTAGIWLQNRGRLRHPKALQDHEMRGVCFSSVYGLSTNNARASHHMGKKCLTCSVYRLRIHLGRPRLVRQLQLVVAWARRMGLVRVRLGSRRCVGKVQMRASVRAQVQVWLLTTSVQGTRAVVRWQAQAEGPGRDPGRCSSTYRRCSGEKACSRLCRRLLTRSIAGAVPHRNSRPILKRTHTGTGRRWRFRILEMLLQESGGTFGCMMRCLTWSRRARRRLHLRLRPRRCLDRNHDQ